MTPPPRTHPAVIPVALCLVGLAFIVAFKILAHYRVASIGAPGDIGGGAIPLVGLILLAVGLGLGVVTGFTALGRRVRRR